MRIILFLITFLLVSYTPGNDRILDADQIKVLNSTYVTLKNDVDIDSNNIFGVNNLTVLGLTTLDPLLNGPLKATTGVVSSGAIDLTSEISGILPIANGGTNSSTALTNDKVMYSSAGAIVESTINPTDIIINPLTTNGDILYFNTAAPQRLAIGTNGQILTVVGGLPQYADAPVSTTLATKGELQGFSTVNASVGPCLNNEILLYDTTQATGWKCSALPSTSPTVAAGDIIYNNTGSPAGDTNLNIGTEGQLLTVQTGLPVWKDAPVSLPDQTAQSGNYLTTDGTNASWTNLNNSTQTVKDNLLECPTFQGCSPEGVITNGAGIDLSGTTTRAAEVPAFNGSKLNLTQSAVGTLDYTYTKTANFDGKQMVAYCEIKTANTNVSFSSMVDGIVQDTLSVSNTDTWKYYKLPFVGGATSQGFKIDHITAGEIPNIDVANCFIGKDANQIREISGASFVGSLMYKEANCLWSSTNTGPLAPYNVDPDCSASNIIKNVSAPTTKKPAVGIPNARTDGYYKVVYTGLGYKTVVDGLCKFSLSSTGSYDNQGLSYLEGATDRTVDGLSGNFRFTTNGNKEIEVLQGFKTGSGSCDLYGTPAFDSKFTVHFFPDDTSTIVTQETELTAKTANEINIKSSSSSIVTTDYGKTSDYSVSIQGTGRILLDYSSLGLTVPPVVNVVGKHQGGVSADATFNFSGVPTTTTVEIYVYANGNAYNPDVIDWTIHKQGADVNKSQTIVGNFNNINDSTPIIMQSEGLTSEATTPSITPIKYTSFEDNSGTWLVDTYTAKEASNYLFIVGLRATTSSINLLSTWVSTDGGTIYNRKHYISDEGTANDRSFGIDYLTLNVGDKVQIRVDASLTTNNDPIASYLKVIEMPDVKAVIANLSKQKTKCQTKNMLSQITSTGTLTDVAFNNLDITRFYSVMANFEVSTTTSVSADKYVYIGSTGLSRNLNMYSRSSTVGQFRFNLNGSTVTKPSSTSLNFIVTAITANERVANGFVTICELPDSVIETTEF